MGIWFLQVDVAFAVNVIGDVQQPTCVVSKVLCHGMA